MIKKQNIELTSINTENQTKIEELEEENKRHRETKEKILTLIKES